MRESGASRKDTSPSKQRVDPQLAQLQKKFDEKLAAQQKQADTLRKQLESTRAKLKAKGEKDADVTIAECDADEAGTPSAHLGHVTQARDGLKALSPLHLQRSLFLDFEAKLAAAEAKLQAAHVAKRAADPLKEQFEKAEAYQARAKKKLEDAKAFDFLSFPDHFFY